VIAICHLAPQVKKIGSLTRSADKAGTICGAAVSAAPDRLCIAIAACTVVRGVAPQFGYSDECRQLFSLRRALAARRKFAGKDRSPSRKSSVSRRPISRSMSPIADCGGQGFIAFKSDATGAIGGMFERAFHFFQFNQDDYIARYHKRSNVESTFSAIKRKFGDSVMSKTDTAMTNEVLCKILCHNLTCPIQEQETLGIAPIFWKDDGEQADKNPAILSMS
jgi:hypothetical protein